MKVTSIRRKMILLFGVLLLVAFFVVFFISRIALQVFLANQIKEDFKEEIDIVSTVFREEFLVESNENDIRNFVEKIQSGKRRVSYFNLDSEIEVVSRINGRIKGITINKEITDSELAAINEHILARDYQKVITMKRKVDGVQHLYRVYIAPLNFKENQEARFFAILFLQVEEEEAVLKQFSRMLLLILLIVYGMTLLGVYVISSKITKPIQLMKDYAINIGRKQKPKELRITTKDELEELAKAMNVMAKDINDINEEQLRFLQNASHELKTPLMSIQGYAEGIMDGVIEDKEDALHIIVDESIRLKKIVNHLSLLSKLETGVLVYKKEPVHIYDCLCDVIIKIDHLAKSSHKQIRIIEPTDKDQFVILGDYDGCIQMFMNILSNGIRYANEEVIIELIMDKKSDSFHVLVTDDGLGIKENAIPHLFERFYKGNKGDTGLGLAIVKAIVIQHDGEITVYNSSIKGGVFDILFHRHQ